MNKLEIVKALLADSAESETEYGGSDVKIVILQRGWVFVGRYSEVGMDCKLEDSKCIRQWGTTKGLGELAENGPTDSTKLDKVNDVSFHELSVVALLDCNDKPWKKVL